MGGGGGGYLRFPALNSQALRSSGVYTLLLFLFLFLGVTLFFKFTLLACELSRRKRSYHLEFEGSDKSNGRGPEANREA